LLCATNSSFAASLARRAPARRQYGQDHPPLPRPLTLPHPSGAPACAAAVCVGRRARPIASATSLFRRMLTRVCPYVPRRAARPRVVH